MGQIEGDCCRTRARRDCTALGSMKPVVIDLSTTWPLTSPESSNPDRLWDMKLILLLFAVCFLLCSASWGQGQCPGDCCCPGGGGPGCQMEICVDAQGNYYLCCGQQQARLVKPAHSQVDPAMTLLGESTKVSSLGFLECRNSKSVDSKVAIVPARPRSFIARLFRPHGQ